MKGEEDVRREMRGRVLWEWDEVGWGGGIKLKKMISAAGFCMQLPLAGFC